MLRCGLASLQTLLGDWDWGFLKSLIQLRSLNSQLYVESEQVSHLLTSKDLMIQRYFVDLSIIRSVSPLLPVSHT